MPIRRAGQIQRAGHRWWDPESEFRPLHAINPLRLDWITGSHRCLQRQARARCRLRRRHPGRIHGARGAEVPGIDLADKSLKVAQLHGLESGVNGRLPRDQRRSAGAASSRRQFDVVTCMEMLEHVPDPASIVRACATLVKPGGWVFFSTHQPQCQGLPVRHRRRRIPAEPAAARHAQLRKFIKPSELAAAVRAAGLSALKMAGMEYNPHHGSI